MIKKDSRLLITGCGGMLGEAVYYRFNKICNVYATDIDVNESWLTYLDVRSFTEVERICNQIRPDYLIHLAALTDLEYCERNVENAYLTNTWGVHNLARQADRWDIPLVHISTAGIFDGKQDVYNEDDLPNPLSVYGKSKYLGELIARSLQKAVVIRAGWMMGGGPNKDKKFINKIVKQLRSGVKELAVVGDKSGTPCYTYDLAKIMHHLIDNQLYGLYHGVCEGGGSRFDVAKFILSTLQLDNKVKLRLVSSDYFKADYFAPRPRSEKLVNKRLQELGIELTRDWQDCLGEYLNKFDW